MVVTPLPFLCQGCRPPNNHLRIYWWQVYSWAMCWALRGPMGKLVWPSSVLPRRKLGKPKDTSFKSPLLNQCSPPAANSSLSGFLDSKVRKEADLNYVKSPSTRETSSGNPLLILHIYPYNVNKSKKMNVHLGL